MDDTARKPFEAIRNGIGMFPFAPGAGSYTEMDLVWLHQALHEHKLWEVMFHDNTTMSLLQFMQFFTHPANLLQIFALVDGNKIVESIGCAWLAGIESCNGKLVRAVGSFGFFPNYQRPKYTDPCAEILFDYWFEELKIDVVTGMTPSENRAALVFLKRLGYKEAGRIKNYTTYGDLVCDGVISYMCRDDYIAGKHVV